MTYAAVRVRGIIINHCVILPENESTKGMLQTVKDYITWGEIDKKVLTKLINERGKIEGDKELTEKHLSNTTSYDTIEKLSDSIINNKFKYKEIPNVKPIFRLNPPKKGYEGIKKSFVNKGALGYRGKEINKLIERMI